MAESTELSTRCLPITLQEYDGQVGPADRLPRHDLRPVLFGLFGEVGSILTAKKKYYREKAVFLGYRRAVEEEFGDVLWYFAALCRRLNIALERVFAEAIEEDDCSLTVAATDLTAGPVAQVAIASANPEFEAVLLELGRAVGALLSVSELTKEVEQQLARIMQGGWRV